MRISLFSFLILIVCNAYAQDKSKKLDSLFSKLYNEDKFAGNVLIAENGKTIFQKSYGKAFREKNVDLNSETVFDLASVSKQFTAMGVMLLKKQGKISYDDSLRKFFPEMPYPKISVRQLLQHTSGLPDYLEWAESNWDSATIMSNKDVISMLEKHHPPKLFSPGEKWEYSNTGYALLASIIEKVSGKSFQDYLGENIFNPLDTSRTRVYRKRFEQKLIDNYAYGYVKDKLGNYVMADSFPETAAMVYSMDGVYGDGVVNSTTVDLLKWDQALYSEKLVSREMVNEALTDARLSNGKTFNYGFGWLLANSKEFGPYYYHAGGWPGYSTWIERHPRENKTIILLANAGSANGSIRAIRKILYGIKDKPIVEIQLEEKLMKRYAGIYRLENGDTVKIRLDAGKLFVDDGRNSERQLYAEAVGLLFMKERDDIRIRMIDNNDLISGLEILREGPVIEGTKVQTEPEMGK